MQTGQRFCRFESPFANSLVNFFHFIFLSLSPSICVCLFHHWIRTLSPTVCSFLVRNVHQWESESKRNRDTNIKMTRNDHLHHFVYDFLVLSPFFSVKFKPNIVTKLTSFRRISPVFSVLLYICLLVDIIPCLSLLSSSSCFFFIFIQLINDCVFMSSRNTEFIVMQRGKNSISHWSVGWGGCLEGKERERERNLFVVVFGRNIYSSQ